jgi:SnoaL-like domain
MARSTRQVIDDHLSGVASLEPAAMAADYAPDAELVRGGDRYVGREAILDYFGTVPARLAGGTVDAYRVDVDGERGTIWWRLVGGSGDGASGRDEVWVRDGMITHQRVHLGGSDF